MCVRTTFIIPKKSNITCTQYNCPKRRQEMSAKRHVIYVSCMRIDGGPAFAITVARICDATFVNVYNSPEGCP